MENRKKEQRVKKTTDDEKNKHTTFLHKLQLLQLRKQENKKKIEEPFYDRLRREDNERDEMVKQSNINRRAQMSKNAAYNDKGQCLLNITTMLENQQNDETKAKAIQARVNKQIEEQEQKLLEERIQNSYNTQQANIIMHTQKRKSLHQMNQERIQQHYDNEKQNEIFATLRLPEILANLTPDKIRAQEKEKSKVFREQLDKETEIQKKAQPCEQLFMGMTDQEILVNQAEFKELGLM